MRALTGTSEETSPVSEGEPGTSFGCRISLMTSADGRARILPANVCRRRGKAAAPPPLRRLLCTGAAAAAGHCSEWEVSAAVSMDKKEDIFRYRRWEPERARGSGVWMDGLVGLQLQKLRWRAPLPHPSLCTDPRPDSLISAALLQMLKFQTNISRFFVMLSRQCNSWHARDRLSR